MRSLKRLTHHTGDIHTRDTAEAGELMAKTERKQLLRYGFLAECWGKYSDPMKPVVAIQGWLGCGIQHHVRRLLTDHD